jgi:hypothetical protein
MPTISDIIQATRANGSHFFDPGAMRFFRSRVSEKVYSGPGGVFFVTSERFEASNGWKAPRGYSVRQFVGGHVDPDASPAFNVLSRSQAHRAARLCAETPDRYRGPCTWCGRAKVEGCCSADVRAEGRR